MRGPVRVVLLSVVVVAGLVTVEITARRSHPEAEPEAILARLESEREGLRTPDAEFHHVGEGIFHLDFPATQIVSAPRILVVGDSFTMGHRVGVEHRFGTVLDRSLDGAAIVDVLATTSYSPIVYRNIVRRALETNRYVCVAVFVDQTDPVDDVIYRKDLVDPESHEFDLARMRDRIEVLGETYDRIEAGFEGVRGLARRFTFVNVLFPPRTILEALPENSPHRPYVQLSFSRKSLSRIFDEEPESSLARTMAASVLNNLDETIRMAHAAGAYVILAANPWEDQVSAAPRVPRASSGPYPKDNRLERLMVDRYGKLPGVTVLELTAAFRNAPDPSGLYIDVPAYEVHWNAAGHELAARVLEDAVDRHVFGARRAPGAEAIAALDR